MFRRIRLRLTVGYVGILTLILLVVGVVVVTGFSRQVTAQQDEFLTQLALNLTERIPGAEEVVPAPGPGEAVPVQSPGEVDPASIPAEEVLPRIPRSTEEEAVLATTETQIAWVSVGSDGGLSEEVTLEGTTPSSPLGLPATELAQQAVDEKERSAATIEGPGGGVRVVSLPILHSGTVMGVIQAGQSRQVVQATINRLILVLVPIGLGALALAALGGLLMSRRAMRPIKDSFERQRTFVADASHELNTPLTLIRAGMEVLARNPSWLDRPRLIGKLLAETDRMNALISNLLLLARLDAGKLAVASKPFDLGCLILETAERFRECADSKKITLKVQASDQLEARGDAERTGQVLAALIDNALRYTPSEGYITVTGSQSSRLVEVVVSDTGPGIDPDHLPHIFDRFYRAEAARTREGGGTGLGLSIARDLAEAQGGKLTVESAEGKGAQVRLELPRS
jgi:signal transduction histidine kinase